MCWATNRFLERTLWRCIKSSVYVGGMNVVHVDGVRRCLWTAPTNGPTVHPAGDIWVWRATVEWWWQGKREQLGGKRIRVPLCLPQIPHNRLACREPGAFRKRSRSVNHSTTTFSIAVQMYNNVISTHVIHIKFHVGNTCQSSIYT
jgi:hypothetical protein